VNAPFDAQVRALLRRVPGGPAGFDLAAAERPRTAGEGLPRVPVAGRLLSVGEVGAALFENCADARPLTSPDTTTLTGLAASTLAYYDAPGFAKLAEDFAALDGREFPEVDVCRWYAWRLAVAHTYAGARSRAMTAGEVATALYLSPWQRTASRSADPRAFARQLTEGAGRVPAVVLAALGAALIATATGTPVHGRWLADRLMPDDRRRRACLAAALNREYPAPLMVRPDAGGLLIGRVPAPGPYGLWPRTLRARW
jgi:hypothetical protein